MGCDDVVVVVVVVVCVVVAVYCCCGGCSVAIWLKYIATICEDCLVVHAVRGPRPCLGAAIIAADQPSVQL